MFYLTIDSLYLHLQVSYKPRTFLFQGGFFTSRAIGEAPISKQLMLSTSLIPTKILIVLEYFIPQSFILRCTVTYYKGCYTLKYLYSYFCMQRMLRHRLPSFGMPVSKSNYFYLTIKNMASILSSTINLQFVLGV